MRCAATSGVVRAGEPTGFTVSGALGARWAHVVLPGRRGATASRDRSSPAAAARAPGGPLTPYGVAVPATAEAPTVVVGAGPAGLATSAALVRAGRPVQLLERADRVGASWAARYDSLHLHTVRWLSGLPGLRIPREYGRWVARDDLVRYLSSYADLNGLRPELGVDVARVDEDGAGWVVRTTAGDRPARRVVMATGYSHTPRRPTWPGVDTFTGDLRHSADYREPSPYAGQHVLVVGAGNSATEIALDLLGAGARVTLSVRTPPNIVRRVAYGIPSQVFGIALK